MVNINCNINKKHAFSLMEATVVMVMVAVFFAASANVFTQKNLKNTEKTAHGRYECYYNGGTLVQQYFVEQLAQTRQTVTECKFTPTKNAAYFVINAVGGGGGGQSAYGGYAGTYDSFFVSSIDGFLKIKPGLGGAVGANGTPTIIKNDRNEEVANVSGGPSGYTPASMLETVSGKDIASCSAVNNSSNSCGHNATCTVYSNYVKVGYCDGAEFKNEDVEFSAVRTNGTISNTLITYNQQLTNLFTLKLNVKNDFKTTSDPSRMQSYLDAIGVDNGVSLVNPGMGGSRGNKGSDGAVVIVW